MTRGTGLKVALFFAVLAAAAPLRPQSIQNAALPDVRKLLEEVRAHQKQVETLRENYTYSSSQTVQDVDAKGNVTKTETSENEDFFVNGHAIERAVKKNGKPLSEHDAQKETERITKLVEKAEKTPPDQSLEGQSISISKILGIMDVSTPRREPFHGRPTIVFDFVGRKDAKAHGIAEEASKKLKGTIWIDEADREVAHLEVSFDDNFHVAAGWWPMCRRGRTSASTRRPWTVDCGFQPAGKEWSQRGYCW